MTREQKTEQEIFDLKVPSRLEYVHPIQVFIGQLVQQLGFCQARIYDIELILDEVCSNAIEHGSESPASGIDLTLIFDSGKLEIHVRDKGNRMRDNWLATGRLDEVSQKMTPDSERGHGIYLTEKLSDYLEIWPNSLGGTDVRVVFYLSPPNAS
jgi:anti-sigma regulatory factor (Ser/Thr protein kinase)